MRSDENPTAGSGERPGKGPALAAFSRYRPRIATLIVLVVVAATVVLANLSFDRGSAEPFYKHKSYGWPLIWHRYVVMRVGFATDYTIGWYYSAPRLAGNLAMWLVMLAAPAGACEWLLRRYRPGLRWSLRTMLAATALAAAACA